MTEPLRILLVDDDDDCRTLVRDVIAAYAGAGGDSEVYEARDGREALAFLRRACDDPAAPRPGLIYLDLEMPGMDGQAVLRAIRAEPALRDIPVVMMTGVSDAGQMREAARNGANSYTVKPADAGRFLQTVAASVDYWRSVHQSPARHAPQHMCRR